MGLFKNRKIATIVAMLALNAAQETRGNSPYLKQIGPPPLRFSLAMANLAYLAFPESLKEKSAPTDITEVAANKSDTIATNAIPQPNPSLSSSTNNLISPSLPVSQQNPTISPAASDMLVVSPQMLTEYFKPGPDGTNSATTVILPVAVGFTPPSAKPTSRATYNSP